jgi:hypothetical protein
MQLNPPKEKSGFALRLPQTLLEKLAALAARENRSINMQIRHLIEEAVERETTLRGAKPDGLHIRTLSGEFEQL